ncbi:MAG: type II toxin-antitoxin system RelE/ParE family toxin [Clostridiales bacterium]|jgi:mRNA interferase RelE/StbE|nr:type II toxin-antitoxin system RelE/ParE family toxin [Clostridiales bacterium]
MKIELSKKADKALKRMDFKTRTRIEDAIAKLPSGDVIPLSGYINTWRLVVGNRRVLFSYPEKGVILIEKIAPRGQAYKEG